MTLTRIALIHTNDLHSHFDRWPCVATVIKAERERLAAQGILSVYLDAGDFLDMSEQVTYMSGGQVAVDLLAAAGCRAQTMGNNELWRTSPARLTALWSTAPFPVLASNLRDGEGQPLPGIRDWAMVEVGPVKVGLLGICEPYPNMAAGIGLDLLPVADALAAAVAACRAAGADLVVHLSHLGRRLDWKTLAEANPGVDAIVGGHSHSLIPSPEVEGGVPMAQAGDLGKHVGTFLLTVADGRLVDWDGYVVPVDPATVAPDPEALAILSRHRAAAEVALSQVVTVLPEALPHEATGPSALGRVLAEALRRRAGAEIGMAVGAQLCGDGLPTGPVTRRQVMDSMPALFLPALLEVPGHNLKAMLEECHDGQTAAKRCGVGGQRPYGQLVGQIHLSGVTYRVDEALPVGERISDVRVNGEPLDPERIYRAGGLSLMAYPESGYTTFAGNKLLKRYMPEQCHEVLLASGLLPPP